MNGPGSGCRGGDWAWCCLGLVAEEAHPTIDTVGMLARAARLGQFLVGAKAVGLTLPRPARRLVSKYPLIVH